MIKYRFYFLGQFLTFQAKPTPDYIIHFGEERSKNCLSFSCREKEKNCKIVKTICLFALICCYLFMQQKTVVKIKVNNKYLPMERTTSIRTTTAAAVFNFVSFIRVTRFSLHQQVIFNGALVFFFVFLF